MTVSLADRDGYSTIAAAEAQVALASGDTSRAQQKFAEAGGFLEKNIANSRQKSEKDLFRFLAATQYYKGGQYSKSFAICRKIQARLLPPHVRHLYPKFFDEVKSRSSSAYQGRMRKKLLMLWQRKQHAQILELLNEHPYVYPRQAMAFIRAVICEELKDYRAAAMFYADTFRFGRADPDLLFTAAAFPLTLPQEGRLDEAWEYVRHQIELIPHTVTYISASLVCFHRASKAQGEQRLRLCEEQMQYFEQARRTFRELPPEHHKHRDLRSFMALGFDAAAFCALRLGDNQRAREVCNEAIAFGPNSANPWTVRGIVTYPSERAVEDFRKAASLGDFSYFPYYYLAHDALTREEFTEAFSLCQQTLAREPSKPIEAQVYGWMAICQDRLRAPNEEIHMLFGRALAADPGNEQVNRNYNLFKESLKSRAPHAVEVWDLGDSRRWEEQYLFDRESRLRKDVNQAKAAKRELNAVLAG